MKKLAALFACLLCLGVLSAQEGEERTVRGFMLQQDGSLWTVSPRGFMVWKGTVRAGTPFDVYVTGRQDSEGNVELDVRSANRLDGANNPIRNDFVRVRYGGEDVFVIRNRMAADVAAGTITTACAVYRSLNVADVRNLPLEAGQLVAVGNTYPVEGGQLFTEITYFDEVNYVQVSGYVKEAHVSVTE